MLFVKLGKVLFVCICFVFRKGIDVGDYFFIILMRFVIEVELGYDVWRLYDFIIRYFIGIVSLILFFVCLCNFIDF